MDGLLTHKKDHAIDLLKTLPTAHRINPNSNPYPHGLALPLIPTLLPTLSPAQDPGDSLASFSSEHGWIVAGVGFWHSLFPLPGIPPTGQPLLVFSVSIQMSPTQVFPDQPVSSSPASPPLSHHPALTESQHLYLSEIVFVHLFVYFFIVYVFASLRCTHPCLLEGMHIHIHAHTCICPYTHTHTHALWNVNLLPLSS